MEYPLESSQFNAQMLADKADPHSAEKLQETYPYLGERQAREYAGAIADKKRMFADNPTLRDRKIQEVVDQIAQHHRIEQFTDALQKSQPSRVKGVQVRVL